MVFHMSHNVDFSTRSKDAPVVDIKPLMQHQKFEEVLRALQPVVASGQADCALLDIVADCYFGLNRPDRGIAVLQAMVATWPDDIPAWGKLGVRCLQNGDKTSAAEAFEQLLSFDPNSARVLSALYTAAPFPADSARAHRLRDLFNAGKVPPAEMADAAHTLGRIFSDANSTDTAFDYFSAAKAATPGVYAPAVISASVAQQCRSFDPARLPEVKADKTTSQPVFVVGLPRSGTTLLETMLLAHSAVDSIGESPALGHALKTVNTALPLQAAPGIIPDTNNGPESAEATALNNVEGWAWCHQADADIAQMGRNAYLAHHPKPGHVGAPGVILDKMPKNLLDMGFARMILPEARFVFMMRHPLDVGLSLYTTNFMSGHAYSKKLDWIGHYIRASYDSLDDYVPKLGDRLHLQSYRKLVEHTEPQMRRILDQLGLAWDPACLSPQSSDRMVITASILQVREDVNRSGLAKWKRFESQLKPLIKALGGWDWIKEWEARDAAL